MKSKLEAKEREKLLADDHWVLPTNSTSQQQTFRRPLVIIEDTLPVYFYKPHTNNENNENIDNDDFDNEDEERVSALLYSGRCKFGPEETAPPQQKATQQQAKQTRPAPSSKQQQHTADKFIRPMADTPKKRKATDFKLPFERDAKRPKF